MIQKEFCSVMRWIFKKSDPVFPPRIIVKTSYISSPDSCG